MIRRGRAALQLLVLILGSQPPVGCSTCGQRGASVQPFLDRSLREQVAALERGEIASADLARAYLARIEARDRGPKGIHAVLRVNPRAEADARDLDGRRGGGALLQGAAILVKDNIDTRGLATTAGSIALAANVPAADAFVVGRLREAHALLLGKANLSEWANFRGERSTSGWSSLGGLTASGFDPAYNPCGSSSGSAAGVAAGLASAALGTETDGSIVCPASVNGVVGFKPTVGLVSRAGVIPISSSQDTVGPITRTVADAARLLAAIAGPDPADPATNAIPPGLSLDFEAPLEGATLSGTRLGVVRFGFSPAVEAVFAAERERLRQAGAVLVEVPLDSSGFVQDELKILTFELKATLDAYLAAHPVAGQPGTLQELIEFNSARADTVLAYFGQEHFLRAQATTGLDDPAYLQARQRARDAAGKNGIDAVMEANRLDALIAPTSGPAWRSDLANGDPSVAGSSGPAAVAGYPHLTVPMGRVGGLPVGLSFFGRAWDDARILALGHAYERLPR